MEETSGWHCMGSKGSQITTMWLLAGAFQAWSATTNPHGEITGYLLLCANSSYIFCLQRNWTQFCLCVVSSSPLREQRASQSTEFVLSPLGPHEDTVLRNPLPILGTSMSFSWDWPPAEPDCPPFPFCLHCCQGQNKSKEKMLLNLKLKNTGHRKPIALSVTKANPELRFLNHLCRKAGKTDWSEHVIIHGAAARKPCCAWLIPERLKLEGGISFHLPHGLLPHSKGTETSPLHCCTCSRDSPSYSEDAIHKHTGLRSSRLVSWNWTRLRCCCLLWIFTFSQNKVVMKVVICVNRGAAGFLLLVLCKPELSFIRLPGNRYKRIYNISFFAAWH